MRLAFVSAHPAPYRDPFLRRLTRSKDLNVKVFTLFSDDNAHSYWNLGEYGYDSELIGRRDEHWLRLFWRLYRKVICGDYDMICWPGFHRPCTKLAMVVCAIFGKCYGFCADSILQPRRGGLLMWVKRLVVKHSSFIFVPGEASKRFYSKAFAFPKDRICTGVYALEGDMIENNIINLRRNNKAALRSKYGLKSTDVIFLMVANMLKTRHYPITSAAFIRFAAEHPDVRFVMVGKGDDLKAMIELSKTNPELVVIPGSSFKDMQELYALSDVYVHGGAEPASSALVIGAIAHLPLISSPAVGCSMDVVREGETGCLVNDYLSAETWYNAFNRILMHRENWSAYGDKARLLSRPLDCDITVKNFIDLLHVCGQ